MTFLTVTFWLLAFTFVAWLTLKIVDYFANKWAWRPEFSRNYIGKHLAICGINDFNRAFTNGSKVGPYVLVPETLVFTDDPAPYRSGGLTEMHHVNSNLELRLFVPYASDRYLSFEEQNKIFKPVSGEEGLGAWKSAKRDEFRRTDWRFKFAAKARRDYWQNTRISTGLATILLLWVVGFASLSAISQSNAERMVTVYATSPSGAVVTTSVQYKDEKYLLVQEDESMHHIVKGRVTKLSLIGGGLTQVCTEPLHRRLHCGKADSSLGVKVGDTVYIQPINTLEWADDNFGQYNTQRGGIVISEAAARALTSTGAFVIVE